jgi:folate-binding protein YgfZ
MSTATRVIPHLTCQLPSRTLLHVHGVESTKFLQGLITNDMNQLSNPNTAMFCHLLNQKGRAMFEAFVATPNSKSDLLSKDGGSYLMECHVDVAARLQRHLKMHKLRSKVKIANLEDSHEVWWSSQQCKSINSQEDSTLCSFVDPRAPTLGTRTFVVKGSRENVSKDDFSVIEEKYNMLRILHGALEGKEVDGVIPLECNLDWLNGVVFDKGCYLGQELTARTHYRGLLRKRCFPVILLENEEGEQETINITPKDIQDIVYGLSEKSYGVLFHDTGKKEVKEGATILNNGGKRAGKMMTNETIGNAGIALMRLEHILGEEEGKRPKRLLTTNANDTTMVVRPMVVLKDNETL